MLAKVYFLMTNHLQSQIKTASWLPHLQDTALWFPNGLLTSWNLAAVSRMMFEALMSETLTRFAAVHVFI